MTVLSPGDTVRLKRSVAVGLAKRSYNARIDWVKRRGTVKSIGTRGTRCMIMWHGLKSLDPLPIAAVEKC